MRTEDLRPNLQSCCSCGACEKKCPVTAIKMQKEADAFSYPVIDQSVCMDCKQCIKICPIRNAESLKQKKNKTAYAAYGENIDLSQSSSGGIFASLADEILKNGGFVGGSILTITPDLIECRHHLSSSFNEYEKMRGSKYVKSDISSLFDELFNILPSSDSKPILICGTPCQIAALRSCFKNKYNNLYLIDLVCHGTPSVNLFEKYIRNLENRKSIQILDFKFRDKKYGHKLTGYYRFLDKNNKESEHWFDFNESSYYSEFLKGSIYQETCYNCPFACENRVGDITIGDYWNLDLADPSLYSQHSDLQEMKGTSVLSVNNEQGEKLLKLYGSGIKKYLSDYQKAAAYNSQMVRPSNKTNSQSLTMLNDYVSFEQKHQFWFLKFRIKEFVRTSIPPTMKRRIKSLIRN